MRWHCLLNIRDKNPMKQKRDPLEMNSLILKRNIDVRQCV